MGQCQAKNKTGRRCRHLARPGSIFCPVHKDNVDWSRVGATAAGAAAGSIAGPIGTVVGGAIGYLVPSAFRENAMKKTKVFVSFDFDNDRALRDFIIGQAKLEDSPFDVVDHSLKEAAPERNWQDKAHAAIARADVVIVMLGSRTRWAGGVLKEIEMAREMEKKIVQIIGYRDGSEDWGVSGAGRVYRWNWENLKKLLS
jgi:hypothetical protein